MAPSWERPPSTPIPFDEHKTKRLEARKKLERLGVDPGIQDTVLYLNELGFCTSESCEGHTDHGNPAPRVALAAPNEPRWRFQGQQTTFETVAAKYRVTVDEVLEYSAPKYEVPPGGFIHDEAREDMLFKVLIEGREQMTKKEETEKFKQWRKETDDVAKKLDVLLQEFYQERNVTGETRLMVEKADEPDSYYHYFLHNGGATFLEMPDPEVFAQLNESEKAGLAARHAEYLNEMLAFTQFLKQKLTSF